MKRTELRSSKGTKLYAVRDSKGHFKDIQTFKRAHGADMKRTAKVEKRQRLIGYITQFWVMTSGNDNKRSYNRAWTRMMKKIDALKLF